MLHVDLNSQPPAVRDFFSSLSEVPDGVMVDLDEQTNFTVVRGEAVSRQQLLNRARELMHRFQAGRGEASEEEVSRLVEDAIAQYRQGESNS